MSKEIPNCPRCNKTPKSGGFQMGYGSLFEFSCDCGLRAVKRYKGPPGIVIWFQDADLETANKYLNDTEAWRRRAVSRELRDDDTWLWRWKAGESLPSPPRALTVQVAFGGEWVQVTP